MNEKPPANRGSGQPRRRRNEQDERYYEYRQPRKYHYDEYEYEEPESPPRRRRTRPHRKRSLWPALLAGCGLGIVLTVLAAAIVVFLALRTSQGMTPVPVPGIGNVQSFTHDDNITVPLSTQLTQLQVCDKIGNISITVNTDRNANTATVVTHKIVHADNKSNADQEFGRIKVEVQPPGTISQPLTCTQPAAQNSSTGNTNSIMIVNATVPDSESFVHGSSDAVDLNITLPQNSLPTDPVLALNVETAVGNINVDGLSGILSIKGSSGNIEINHAILADGSHIETGQGNITFNGLLAKLNNAQPRYTLQSEQGKIDVTLPADTNVILDANTNVGKISSEFGTNIQNNNGNGTVNYHGPLNSSAGTPSNAVLILDVSTGDVNIHKAQ